MGRRLPDRLRIALDMRPPTASPARTELRAGRCYGLQLDGAKSIGQIHREHGYQKNRSHR